MLVGTPAIFEKRGKTIGKATPPHMWYNFKGTVVLSKKHQDLEEWQVEYESYKQKLNVYYSVQKWNTGSSGGHEGHLEN